MNDYDDTNDKNLTMKRAITKDAAISSIATYNADNNENSE